MVDGRRHIMSIESTEPFRQFTDLVTMKHHPNGIYEIIVNHSRTQATEALFDCLLKAQAEHIATSPDSPLRILIDVTRASDFSMRQMAHRILEDKSVRQPRSRMAVLNNNKMLWGFVIRTIQNLQLVRKDDVMALFTPHEHEKAVEWLIRSS